MILKFCIRFFMLCVVDDFVWQRDANYRLHRSTKDYSPHPETPQALAFTGS